MKTSLRSEPRTSAAEDIFKRMCEEKSRENAWRGLLMEMRMRAGISKHRVCIGILFEELLEAESEEWRRRPGEDVTAKGLAEGVTGRPRVPLLVNE